MTIEESCCTCATPLSAVPRTLFLLPRARSAITSSSSASSPLWRQQLPPSKAESEKNPVEEEEEEEEQLPPPLDEKDATFSEKSGLEPEPVPAPDDRRLGCCARVICGKCIHKNDRFASYCPYCQISTGPSSLPAAGLKNPPGYSAVPGRQPSAGSEDSAPPPPYSSAAPPPKSTPLSEKQRLGSEEEEDVLHFLDHSRDTVSSLSLRYGVPADSLRRANRLGSDHLLLGRRVVVIPPPPHPSSNPRASFSPRPVEGEEEERRKAKVRRWMVACKEADYDVALLYLEQAGYDLDAAVEAYFADEDWERDHPVGEHREEGTAGKLRRSRNASAVGGSSSSSSSSASTSRGRFGLGGGAGEGGWLWASQAAFLGRRGDKRPPGSL